VWNFRLAASFAPVNASNQLEGFDLIRNARDRYSKRKHLQPKPSEADLAKIKICIIAALDL
jgi:hypothetical protein